MLYPISPGGLTPFSRPHPITHDKNSVCVLDFPLDLHNPAHSFSSGRQSLSSLSWFVLQNGDLLIHFPTPCSSHLTRFQLYGKAKSSLYLTLSPLLPPGGWAGGGQRARQLIGVRSQPRARAHARTRPHSLLSSPPKQDRLTWQSRAGPRGVPRPPDGWE